MKALLWRVLYVVLVVFMIYWLAPLVATAIHFPVTPPVQALAEAVIACLAVLYIIWGPPPSAPF